MNNTILNGVWLLVVGAIASGICIVVGANFLFPAGVIWAGLLLLGKELLSYLLLKNEEHHEHTKTP